MLGAPGEHMCVGRCLPPAPSVLRIVHIPSPIHGLATPVLLLHGSEPYRRSTTKAAEPRTIPPVTLKARKAREEIVSPRKGNERAQPQVSRDEREAWSRANGQRLGREDGRVCEYNYEDGSVVFQQWGW